MRGKTVVVTARVDACHLAELVALFELERGIRFRSKSELLRYIVDLAEANEVKDRLFNDSDRAISFLVERDLINSGKSTYEKLGGEGREEKTWREPDLSVLERARISASKEDAFSQEEEDLYMEQMERIRRANERKDGAMPPVGSLPGKTAVVSTEEKGE